MLVRTYNTITDGTAKIMASNKFLSKNNDESNRNERFQSVIKLLNSQLQYSIVEHSNNQTFYSNVNHFLEYPSKLMKIMLAFLHRGIFSRDFNDKLRFL